MEALIEIEVNRSLLFTVAGTKYLEEYHEEKVRKKGNIEEFIEKKE